MASRLPRFVLPLASGALLLLPGCGGNSSEQFAPPCPVPSIPRDFGDLHRFRGNGRDMTDSVLEGRITGLDGLLRPRRLDDDGGHLLGRASS